MTPGEIVQAVTSPTKLICQNCFGKLNHDPCKSGLYFCGNCLTKGTNIEKKVFALQLKVKALNDKIKKLERKLK